VVRATLKQLAKQKHFLSLCIFHSLRNVKYYDKRDKRITDLYSWGINCESSSFRRGVVKVFALQTCYKTLVGQWRFVTAYRYHLQGTWTAWPLKMGPNIPPWNGDNQLTTNQSYITSLTSESFLVTVDAEFISVEVSCIADNEEKCSFALCRVTLLTSVLKRKSKCTSETSVSPFTFTRCQHSKIGEHVQRVHMKIQLALNDNNNTPKVNISFDINRPFKFHCTFVCLFACLFVCLKKVLG
jgi:hypothetical protein